MCNKKNILQAVITDDTLHTPHIFPYISDVLPASNQILSEDNVEECPSTVSLTEKNAKEVNALEPEVCSTIKLNTNETQELMKDGTSGKNSTLASDIIVSNTNTPIAPKLLPTQPSSHL